MTPARAARCGEVTLSVCSKKKGPTRAGKPIALAEPERDGMQSLPGIVLAVGVEVHGAAVARVDLLPAARRAEARAPEVHRGVRVNHRTSRSPGRIKG